MVGISRNLGNKYLVEIKVSNLYENRGFRGRAYSEQKAGCRVRKLTGCGNEVNRVLIQQMHT